MNYNVTFGSQSYEISAGNPYQACMKALAKFTDGFNVELPRMFEVYKVDDSNNIPENTPEEIQAGIIVELCRLNNKYIEQDQYKVENNIMDEEEKIHERELELTFNKE